MTRATRDTFNPQVFRARTDGDAIVSRLNVSVLDGDLGRDLYMNAIRVRAVSGGSDFDGFD